MDSHDANAFLFEACERGDLSVIQQHIDSLSLSEIAAIRDEHEASLAHYACRHNHLHILAYLIQEKHLDLSQILAKHGSTCAHEAAVCDRKIILDYIFHYPTSKQHRKLRWYVKDDQGNSPLHLAAGWGSPNVLRYLLDEEFADAFMRSRNGFQPLHFAAAEGHIECAKILLNSAPETVNGQTNNSLTPLYLACQNGNLDMIQLLLLNRASLKIKDDNGLTCLHAACQRSHLDVVQRLVENHNANVNDVDYSDNTPLHYAAANGNEAILTYLLEKNARVTAASNGNTLLHVAAQNGHQNVCILLIETGNCVVDATNLQKLTPADLADRAGFPALANELCRRAEPPPPISTSLASPMAINDIRLEKATIARVIVKRENVSPKDASCQTSEDSATPPRTIQDGLGNIRLENLIKPPDEESHRTGDRTTASPSAMDPNFDSKLGSFSQDFENSRGSMSYRRDGYPLRPSIVPTKTTQQSVDPSNKQQQDSSSYRDLC